MDLFFLAAWEKRVALLVRKNVENDAVAGARRSNGSEEGGAQVMEGPVEDTQDGASWWRHRRLADRRTKTERSWHRGRLKMAPRTWGGGNVRPGWSIRD